MFEHRLREYFAETQQAVVAVAQAVAFVPCPMFAAFAPAQQSFVAEVYRRAFELTQIQLAPPRIPAFSLN